MTRSFTSLARVGGIIAAVTFFLARVFVGLIGLVDEQWELGWAPILIGSMSLLMPLIAAAGMIFASRFWREVDRAWAWATQVTFQGLFLPVLAAAAAVFVAFILDLPLAQPVIAAIVALQSSVLLYLAHGYLKKG